MSKTSHSEYREIIESYARDKVNARVLNGLTDHAQMLIETMFNHASSEMRIYSKNLSKEVFEKPETIAAIQDFLGSKPYARLRILLEDSVTKEWVSNHKLLKMIQGMKDTHKAHGHVEIVSAVGNYASGEVEHFTVMDNDGYRYEFDHDNCKAVANFNEPTVAKKLLSVFDEAFSLAKKEPLNLVFTA